MKTAEKTIRDMGDQIPFSVYEKAKPFIIEAMKSYGKQCAEQALKDAAENAKTSVISEYEVIVNKQSILNTKIQLP